MAEFKELSDGFYVAGQINEADIAAAKDLGVTHVVCNRPDGEELGQPNVATVASWAEAAGMSFEHIPLGQDGLSMNMIDDTAAVIGRGDKVLAYCRTGNRCSILWSLASAKSNVRSTEEILGTTEKAGYDLSHLADALENIRG